MNNIHFCQMWPTAFGCVTHEKMKMLFHTTTMRSEFVSLRPLPNREKGLVSTACHIVQTCVKIYGVVKGPKYAVQFGIVKMR